MHAYFDNFNNNNKPDCFCNFYIRFYNLKLLFTTIKFKFQKLFFLKKSVYYIFNPGKFLPVLVALRLKTKYT